MDKENEPLRGAEEHFKPASPPQDGKAQEHRFWHVLVRDGFTCQLCGSRSRLQVHHVKPRARGGDDSVTNLLTLCHACHASVHEGELRLGETG